MIVFLLLAAAAPQCPAVHLALGDMPASYRGRRFREISANFDKAYAKACSEGLLKGKVLAAKLVLSNAPDANIASIYAVKGRSLLEYPFVTRDRQTHVPAVGELHEAIYCAVHGASAKEQEESGRCLPD